MTLQLGFSWVLAAFLITVHALAVATLWMTPIPIGLRFALSALLLVSVAWNFRLHAMRSLARALVALEIKPDCRCAVRTRGDGWMEGEILQGSFVTPYLTILNIAI
ncbi:MAG: hypothetical protein ACREUA_03885, partial [Burkholderiales bacterium]